MTIPVNDPLEQMQGLVDDIQTLMNRSHPPSPEERDFMFGRTIGCLRLAMAYIRQQRAKVYAEGYVDRVDEELKEKLET